MTPQPSLAQPILFRCACPRCQTRGSFVVDGTGPHCLSCGYDQQTHQITTVCNGKTYFPDSVRVTKQRQYPVTARCIKCLKRAGVKNGVLVRHDYPRTPQGIARVNTQAAMEAADR